MLLLQLHPNAPQQPTGVSLNQKTATGAVGTTKQLTATVEPENAEDKTVTWESSDPAVATVDVNGLVTFVAEGTATITAKTVNDLTATCAVTVSPATK